MSLSRKVILLIVSTFIGLVFIVATTSDLILLHSFANLEQKVLRDDISKVINEIQETFSELDATAKDYSEQMRRKTPGWVKDLDIESFVTHRADLVACYGLSGEVLAVRTADYHGRRFSEISPDELSGLHKVVRTVIGQGGGKPWHGFVALGGSVAQFTIRPVTDGTVMVVGRHMDKEEIIRVSSLTKFEIEVRSADAEDLPGDFSLARTQLLGGAEFHSVVIDKDRIAGYAIFKDVYDQPLLLLKITEDRLVYKQGKVSIMYILLALVIFGAVFCGVMLLFVRDAVLKRLGSLNRTVGEISRTRDISARLKIRGGEESDELDELSQSINSMLGSLEAAEYSLKESEERYRTLFERAPDSIFIIGAEGDEAGRIMAANSAAAEQHGYSVEELCAMNIYDLNAPECNPATNELMARIANGEWVTFEIWHTRKDGSRFPLEVHSGPLRIQGRSYVIGFDRDITSRKLAEESDRIYLEQIHQLNAELGRKAVDLELANRELESFNYSVSHDMRGPLTRISGYSQLMLDDTAAIDPQYRTYLSRIYESSCWLDEMIDAMLRLSQLVSADFSPEPVNLAALCREQLDSLRQAEPGRTVEMVIEADVTVFGDESLLRVLVNNLVNNAWKYTAPVEHARIEFGAMRGGTVPVFYVRDNGTGFDMKDAGKLFRPFSRLHDPTLFTGSGIGLATVQRIISRHGGRIWAEAEEGKGATFFFTLAPDVKAA
jgi:PAS domain S-box-containing protein